MQRIIHYNHVGFITRMKGSFNILNSIFIIYHINRIKRKQMIIPIDAGLKLYPIALHGKNNHQMKSTIELPQPDKEH